MTAIQLKDDLTKKLLAVAINLKPQDIRDIGVELRIHHETVRSYLKGCLGLNLVRGEEILTEANDLLAKNERAEKQKQLLLSA